MTEAHPCGGLPVQALHLSVYHCPRHAVVWQHTNVYEQTAEDAMSVLHSTDDEIGSMLWQPEHLSAMYLDARTVFISRFGPFPLARIH